MPLSWHSNDQFFLVMMNFYCLHIARKICMFDFAKIIYILLVLIVFSHRDCLRGSFDLPRPAVPLRSPSTLQCDPQPWLLPCMWAASNQGYRDTVWPKQGLHWSQQCEWRLLCWLIGSEYKIFCRQGFGYFLFPENVPISNKTSPPTFLWYY